MTLETLLDRGPLRRSILLATGLAVMLLALVHRLWPGEPLYLCGATVTVLSALPRRRAADRSTHGAA